MIPGSIGSGGHGQTASCRLVQSSDSSHALLYRGYITSYTGHVRMCSRVQGTCCHVAEVWCCSSWPPLSTSAVSAGLRRRQTTSCCSAVSPAPARGQHMSSSGHWILTCLINQLHGFLSRHISIHVAKFYYLRS